MHDTRGEHDPASPIGILAVLITAAGASVLFLGYFWDIPLSLAVVGTAAWVVGWVIACALAAHRARTEGGRFLGVLWAMIRMTGRWVWHFMP